MNWFRVGLTGLGRLSAACVIGATLIGGWSAENARELVFGAGLVLMSSGLALVSIPAALIVPGAILTWLAIPPAPRARKS